MWSNKNNIMYGGYAALHNGKVFFANPADGFRLYMGDADMANAKRLYSSKVSNINVSDEAIWFCGEDDFYYKMDRHAPGKAFPVVKKPCYFVYAFDDALYYLGSDEKDNERLFAANVDGSNERACLSSADEPLATERGIFYTVGFDDPELYFTDRSFTNGRRLNTLATLNLTLDGDYLYFCEGDVYFGDRDMQFAYLHKMRVFDDNKSDERALYKSSCVLSHDVAHIVAGNSMVYFQDRNNGRRLNSYNTETGEFAIISKGKAYRPQALGSYVFYLEDGGHFDSGTTYRLVTNKGETIKVINRK